MRGSFHFSIFTHVCDILRRGAVIAEQGLNSRRKKHTMQQHAIQALFPHFNMYYRYHTVFVYFGSMHEAASLLNYIKNHVQLEC